MSAKKLSWFLRAGASLGLGLVSAAGCDCVEGVNKVAPQIAVDVCQKPVKEVNGKVIGGTDECALPFGSADLAVRTERFITITNPSGLELRIKDKDGNPGISFAADGDEGFAFINEPPTSIGPGLSAQVGVSIRPTLESGISREIIILSDANNAPPNEDGLSEIHIPITLTGVDNGVPEIEIVPDSNCGSTTPLSVDFGRVAVGGLSVCNVLVKNNGTRELFFDSVGFALIDGAEIVEPAGSDAVPALLSGTPPNPEQALPPTSPTVPGFPLRLTFAPDVLGRYQRSLRIVSSDPVTPVIEIPILGLGVDGPTCTARVKSVGGVEVTGTPSIEPLDDVVLTADALPATPDGNIVSYSWEIRERGPGSGVVLSAPTSQETAFAFANRRGVDVAGPYEACVTVVDDLGTEGVAPCCVDFEAIPSDSFLVQLTWVGDDDDDMDLHVTKKDARGNYCVSSLGSGSGHVNLPLKDCNDGLDCGYYNCRVDEDAPPEWDGAPSRSDGDPSLDIDDTNGFGPENINVDVATAGSYAFGASYFGGEVPVAMFVRLFLFGRLAGEWVQTVDSDFFEVGIVHFTAEDPTHPCVEDLTDGNPADQCPGF